MGSNVMMNMNMMANGTKQSTHSTEDFAAPVPNNGIRPNALTTK
jgi:hypothetical protein